MSDDFDLRSFLPYLLNQAAETQSRAFQHIYKGRYGMLRTEWRVLFHLGRHGPMTAKTLCDHAYLHKTKVSRAVRALELKRYLTRTERPEDRRHATLSLTRSGKDVFQDLTDKAYAFNSTLNAGLSETEAQILQSCLLRLSNLPHKGMAGGATFQRNERRPAIQPNPLAPTDPE